jgi:hypothetical protein
VFASLTLESKCPFEKLTNHRHRTCLKDTDVSYPEGNVFDWEAEKSQPADQLQAKKATLKKYLALYLHVITRN